MSVMGDGMNRILSLILGLVNCKDGVCFIDEIENGVYYRRQPALWKIISHLVGKLMKRKNRQIPVCRDNHSYKTSI